MSYNHIFVGCEPYYNNVTIRLQSNINSDILQVPKVVNEENIKSIV